MYQGSSLITTKFNIPVTSSKLVKRPWLFKKLDAFSEYKLILITAPAGYGKTALITSWLAEKKKSRLITAWVSLDEYDNDPECFWSYFLWSLYRKIPHNAEDMGSFNRLHLSHFINAVYRLNEDVLMVVDEFDVIKNNKIIENMKFLIRNMPSNLHILIISRMVPEFGIARLMDSDSVLKINKNDLSFTKKETNQFFYNLSGISLPLDKCNIICDETEGWAAGIQMMALSVKDSGKNVLNKYIDKNNHFVFEYMAEEVFSKLNKNIQKFLLYTSVPDEFSEEICNYLLGIENSGEIIREIESLNLFLICIDYEHNWFRYHNLFKSFLRKQLEGLGHKVVHDLFDKTAQWYEDNSQISSAVENYIRGTNFNKAALLIEKVSGEILCRGEAKLLHKWNKMLPEEIVRSSSRLIMNSAWAASADGKANEVSEYIIMAQRCQVMHKGMEAEIAALISTNITGEINPDEIMRHCEDAVKLLKPKEFLTRLITFNMAKIYLLEGEHLKAVEYFEKCMLMSIKTGDTYILIMANKALITWDKLRGEYRQAEQKCIGLISKLKVNGDIVLPVAGVIYAELSDIYYEWNEMEKSMEMAKNGLKLGLDGEDTWTTTENYLMLAKIYYSMNLNKEYMNVVYKLREYLRYNDFLDVRLKSESLNAEVSIRNKDILPVLKWLNDILPLIKNNLNIICPEVYFVKVKLYIYKNELGEARKILNLIQEDAEKYELYSLLVKVKILNSMIYEKGGYIKEAISELERAAALACKQKAARDFLDEGYWMEDMLKRLRNSMKYDSKADMIAYVDILLAGFNENFKSDIVEKGILSKREIEILEFIQKGATNSQISAKLYISINTVKTHLLNIYTKLDVHSRTGAVAKARKLNLI